MFLFGCAYVSPIKDLCSELGRVERTGDQMEEAGTHFQCLLIIVSKGPDSICLPTYLSVILMTTTNGSKEGRAANIT